MWRRFGIVLVLLLLGAILNVAVAWSAMLLGEDISGSHHSSLLEPPPQEVIHGLRRFGYESVGSFVVPDRVAKRTNFDHAGRPAWWNAEMVPSPHLVTWAGGWPMLSVTAWATEDGSARSVRSGVEWEPPDWWPNGLRGQSLTQGPTMVFPIRPIWTGFLVNTLFYATIVWLLLATFTMRSRVRAWRGQCVRCGYPRGESSVCSECGAAVKPRVSTAPMVEWHALREKGPQD